MSNYRLKSNSSFQSGDFYLTPNRISRPLSGSNFPFGNFPKETNSAEGLGNRHSQNISKFIKTQMTQDHQPERSISTQNVRDYFQSSENLRQQRMKERRDLIQDQMKAVGPQYDFGGVSYLPAKTSAVPYRTSQSSWNASDVKSALLEWCRRRTSGYKNVRIENFSTSWSDGLAFCALVHHFHPEAFDFDRLSPQNRRFNFSLAFDMAERLANVPAILDVDDMVAMSTPDWKSVFTYLQSVYAAFRHVRS